jgi:hypothetical protein
MKALLLFFRGWLGLYFVLVHFVVPFYLVAIYPDVPEPMGRFMRGFGYGVVRAPPSEIGFWYRFLSCGAWVGLGLVLLWHRLRRTAEVSSQGADGQTTTGH